MIQKKTQCARRVNLNIIILGKFDIDEILCYFIYSFFTLKFCYFDFFPFGIFFVCVVSSLLRLSRFNYIGVACMASVFFAFALK